MKGTDYQRLFGVKKETFDKMMDILEKAYIEKHKKGGKRPKLTVFDKLIITLQYYREYRTMEHIAGHDSLTLLCILTNVFQICSFIVDKQFRQYSENFTMQNKGKYWCANCENQQLTLKNSAMLLQTNYSNPA